ncbi:MAG: DUF4296 domain-containing protein [Bacteroidales bacterium]|nr:DUF4296 domain-containing protein [Bacteroidales bacterium]
MENLLVDIHKAEAYMENSKYLANNKLAQDSVKNSIYAKHGVTGAEFDTSIVWYGANLEEYIEIYDKVIMRLQEENNSLLALMNNQKDMFTGMTRSGDTVNIWNINPHYIFEGRLNNNLLSFTVPYDDNFKDGDLFKLKFKLTSREDSPYESHVILAVKESRDSTTITKKNIFKNGWDSIEVKSKGSIRRVMGSFYVPAIPEWRVTHIDSITLERIHTK